MPNQARAAAPSTNNRASQNNRTTVRRYDQFSICSFIAASLIDGGAGSGDLGIMKWLVYHDRVAYEGPSP